MKKLINRPEAVVEEMVDGFVAIYPGLRRIAGHTVIARSEMRTRTNRRVALISGGGSGHEPAHAGYIGHGMLSAAVAGEVFTSPSPDAVLAAIRVTAGPAGAVLVVKNYTGDRLNFGLAAELAKAEGIPVEIVIVDDDAALAGSDSLAGARGLAGAIFVHKVAGAASEAGLSLEEVAAEARATVESVATMGVALTPCIVPAAGKPGFALGDDEIELGLGIHGEPGIRKSKIEPADSLVDIMVTTILDRLKPANDARVALLVNNLGGTPTMELAIVARHAIKGLEARGLTVERVYMGTFLSALEMGGVSLSVLLVGDTRLARLDAPTEAPAWPNTASLPRRSDNDPWPNPTADNGVAALPEPPNTPMAHALESTLRAATSAVTAATDSLTELDQAVGDGDLGISLDRGSHAILEAIPAYDLNNPSATLQAVGVTLQKALGGTSGPLYAMLFLAAADHLKSARPEDPLSWAEAFAQGVARIGEVGGAQPGERTMLDALIPASQALSSALSAGQSVAHALDKAAAAAEAGGIATADLKPRRGRSSYLGDRALGHPDPGAVAVGIWLRAVADQLASLAR